MNIFIALILLISWPVIFYAVIFLMNSFVKFLDKRNWDNTIVWILFNAVLIIGAGVWRISIES